MLWSSSPTTHRLPAFFRNKGNKLVLQRVRILVLIDKYMGKPVHPIVSGLWILLQYFDGYADYIVEIKAFARLVPGYRLQKQRLCFSCADYPGIRLQNPPVRAAVFHGAYQAQYAL